MLLIPVCLSDVNFSYKISQYLNDILVEYLREIYVLSIKFLWNLVLLLLLFLLWEDAMELHVEDYNCFQSHFAFLHLDYKMRHYPNQILKLHKAQLMLRIAMSTHKDQIAEMHR